MSKDSTIVPVEIVAQRIVLIRGHRVILDRDLAALYGVETRALNQAVKRNHRRFPEDFMFDLSREEILRISQYVTSSSGLKFSKHVLAFTEQRVAMLSSVLKSERAVQMNIAIMRAFVKLSETLANNRELAHQFAELHRRVGWHDEQLNAIMQAIRKLMTPSKQPRREIGFHVRDAASDKTPQSKRRLHAADYGLDKERLALESAMGKVRQKPGR